MRCLFLLVEANYLELRDKNFDNRQDVRSKNGDGSWKTSWKLLCEQSNCVVSYFKPHQRHVLTRSALVFLTGYETCWMKVGNCSGLPHCSNNPNNISSFSLSNHGHLSLPPVKQCFCASLCLYSWLEDSSSQALRYIWVGFIFKAWLFPHFFVAVDGETL